MTLMTTHFRGIHQVSPRNVPTNESQDAAHGLRLTDYGGNALYEAKRPSHRLSLFILIAAAWLLAACGGVIANANWPGLSAEGDIVYVAFGDGVLAYNVQAQREEWVFSPVPGRLHFYAAPAVENGRVVLGDFGMSQGFLSPRVVVRAYSVRQSGTNVPDELWNVPNIASDRIVAPPLLIDGRVFIGTADNQVIALDADDGTELWRFLTGHSIWGRPSYKEGTLFVASLDRNVYALDAETGRQLWVTELGGAIASSVVVDTNLVYVTSFDQKMHALDRATGDIAWSVEATAWIWGAPVMRDGVVYFADAAGVVYAVDAQNGRVLWSISVEGNVQTTPAFANNVLYVVSDKDLESKEPKGIITAISTTENGRVLWQQEPGLPVFTTPVVVGDTLVVVVPPTSDTLLIGYDAMSGAQRWKVAPPNVRR